MNTPARCDSAPQNLTLRPKNRAQGQGFGRKVGEVDGDER